jgi:cell division protein FtsB
MSEFILVLWLLSIILCFFVAISLIKIPNRLRQIGEEIGKHARQKRRVEALQRQIDELKRELEEMKQKR